MCRKVLSGFALIVVASAAIVGCTSFTGGARLETPTENTARDFHGLIPALEDGEDKSKVRYVFVIHGMGKTEKSYSEPLLDGISKYGYTRTTEAWRPVKLRSPMHASGEAFKCDAANAPPCLFDTFGELRFDRFTQQGASPARKIVVVTFYWHTDLEQIQSVFLARDRLETSGALINTALKHGLIDAGFSDATAFLSGAGSLAKLGIEGAVCAMLRDAADPEGMPRDGPSNCQFSELTEDQARRFGQVEYSFLSFSLGSRMLYEVLSGGQEDAKIARDSDLLAHFVLVLRTRNFFMAANQMPLLGLGRVTVGEQPVKASSTNESFFSPSSTCGEGFFSAAGCLRGSGKMAPMVARFNIAPLREGLQVIAFHDPADLLGFRASGGIKDPGSTTFVEIRNRNAPVFLGLLAWPPSAHAKELEHDASRLLIICGGSADGKGRLRPHSCKVP